MGFSLTNAGGFGGGGGLATFKDDEGVSLAQGQSHTIPLGVPASIVEKARDFRVSFGVAGTAVAARSGTAGNAVLNLTVQRLNTQFNPETRTPARVARTTALTVGASSGATEIYVPRSNAIQVNQRVVIGTDTHRVNSVADSTRTVSGSTINTTTVTLDGYHDVASATLAADTRMVNRGQGFNITIVLLPFV